LETCRFDAADYLAGQRGGGDVSITVRFTEERVTHRAADDSGLLALPVERSEDVAQRRLAQPCGIQPAACLRHFVPPGTKRPSSRWAETGGGPGGEPPHCAKTRKRPIRSTSAAITSQATRGRLQESGCSTPACVAHKKTA